MNERHPNSLTKAWLAEFLLVRSKFSGPDGIPLHKYDATDAELVTLKDALLKADPNNLGPVWAPYWGAAFCLFVAEKYRREYDASEGGWSWQGFEGAIGVNLGQQRRTHYVRSGLAYWKRPVRERSGGFDYLGSLFDEGGLPWRLLQSDSHGFGRAIRAGIRRYHISRSGGSDLISVIQSHGIYFPQTFRTTEKYQLIAAIVEWLMNLADRHDLANLDDPAAFLDKHASGWRTGSPLPVGEENGRAMVNGWLRDAGRVQKERRRIEEEARNFTCEHSLIGELSSWKVKSEVFLPQKLIFRTEISELLSTRFEVAFFEGDELMVRAGIVYGKINEAASTIETSLANRHISIERHRPEQPLTVQLLSNGQSVHASYFENSDIDFLNLPMVVVNDGDKYEIVGTSSMTVASGNAVIRLPAGFSFQEGQLTQIAEDDRGGRWFEVSEDLSVSSGQSTFILRTHGQVRSARPSLRGDISLFDTLPNLTYRGWPTAELRQAEGNVPIKLFLDGKPVNQATQRTSFGVFTLTVAGDAGETLLRRRIGVLPDDLQVMALPVSSNSPAKLIVRSEQALAVDIKSPGLKVSQTKTTGGQTLMMQVEGSTPPPDCIDVEIADTSYGREPVTLRIPYPHLGACVFDDQGAEIKTDKLLVAQLLGTTLSLTSADDRATMFHIVLEPIGRNSQAFRRTYRYQVKGQPARISLFAFQDDIEHVLGTTANQDAEVRLRIETDRQLKQLIIARYQARLLADGTGCFELQTDDRHEDLSGVQLCAMRLDDPAAGSIAVPERNSAGVGIGVFEVPSPARKHGPWLLHPAKKSTVQFRPAIWVNESDKVAEAAPNMSVQTLHSAAKLFHPIYNPNVFNIVITSMASDLTHSGWDYLNSLREGYPNIPLSAFEAWCALARDESALAAAAFRLEMDDAFCKRLSNELAVIWETVSIDTWCTAQDRYLSFIGGLGIDEEAAHRFAEQRRRSLASWVRCFQHLSVFFQNSDITKLPALPMDTLIPIWYQDLRHRNVTGENLPSFLEQELTHWVSDKNIPEVFSSLAELEFSLNVIYLPVFMAHVSAGKALISDLDVSPVETRFGIRVLSDIEREQWYEPVYALMLSHLLMGRSQG